MQKKLKEFGLSIEVSDYSNPRKLLMIEMEHRENVTTGVVYNRTLTQGKIEMEISFRVSNQRQHNRSMISNRFE